MNKILKGLPILIFVLLFAVLFLGLGYLLLPNPDFPKPPPDSIQSKEPADTETPLRRAYFTNYTRAQVLSWYGNQMKRSSILNLPLPTYLLNYPPEDSQTIIRDQTRSTFLQEIVHPFRESVYINGFEPASAKDAIFIENKPWRQKIIIRYVPSSIWVRILVFISSVLLSIFLFKAWIKTLSDIRKIKIKI